MKSELLDGQNGISPLTPGEENWERTRALSGRAAVRACMDCRNAASRGVDNMADQVGAIEKIAQAAMVAVPRGFPTSWTKPERILVPTGTPGRTVFVFVDGFTKGFEVEVGELEAVKYELEPEEVLRWMAGKLRKTATDCCRQAVKRRLWKQTNKLRRVEVPYHRSRVPEAG